MRSDHNARGSEYNRPPSHKATRKRRKRCYQSLTSTLLRSRIAFSSVLRSRIPCSVSAGPRRESAIALSQVVSRLEDAAGAVARLSSRLP